MIKTVDLFKTDFFKNISFAFDNGVLCILSKKPERSAALLETLAGIKFADGGEVKGIKKVSYLPKGSPLPLAITAKEYIDFIQGIKKVKELSEKISDIIESFSEKRIEFLSNFERFTLCIASSLIGDPDLIISEDPYYNLSYDEYGDLKFLIKSVSEDVPVIFSSSSVFECKEISNKLLVMSAGNQIYFGDTKTLFSTDIHETDIICLIRGEKESINAALSRFNPEITETVRENIYCVNVKKIAMFKAAETRNKIKKQLTKAKLPLLELRSDKEALLNIIGELTEKDKAKRSEYEENKPSKITKITKSLISFNHDDDNETEKEDTEIEESIKAEDTFDFSEDE